MLTKLDFLDKNKQKRYNERERIAKERINLPDPSVEADLAKPANIVGITEDGYIPVQLLNEALQIRILRWANVEGGEEIQLFLEHLNTEIVATIFVPEEDEEGFDFEYLETSIPQKFLGQGRKTILYKIISESGDEYPSEPASVIIDLIAPTPAGPASLPDNYDDTITAENIVDNPNGIPLNIPPYLTMEAGDIVKVSFIPQNGKALIESPYTITEEDVAEGKIIFSLSTTNIENTEDGSAQIFYNLQDRAGNVSARSADYYINIVTKPEPINLTQPEIPLAVDGITDQDAREPVIVRIPKYGNILPGDIVTVWWDKQKLSPAVVPDPVPSDAYPLNIAVPREAIWKAGSGTLPVSYTVTRGKKQHESAEVEIDVDLNIPGPEDEDKGTNVNEQLAPLDIKGAVSDTLNQILPDDLNKGAVATVPAYTPRKEGEKIQIYWGASTTPDVEYTVTAEDVSNTTLNAFTIDIPAGVVDTSPENPAFPVRYELANETNTNLAPTTYIGIRLVSPGGPDGLKDVEPQSLSSKGWITNKGNVPFAKIFIQVYENMKVGDRVTLNWIGNNKKGALGEDMEETRYSHSVDVNQQSVYQGVYIDVPYDPYLKAIGRKASVKISYIVTQDGIDFSSNVSIFNVDSTGPLS